MANNAYAQSGVDVEAGYEVVERIKKHVARTERAGVLGALGGFGGAFDLSATGVKEPVLISGTDGVGTKLMLAIQADKHDTIGIDCVAMCVNDVLAQGAEPLFFLDYIASGKIDPAQIAAIVGGVAAGCVQAGAALTGGETAEMPDMYALTAWPCVSTTSSQLGLSLFTSWTILQQGKMCRHSWSRSWQALLKVVFRLELP